MGQIPSISLFNNIIYDSTFVPSSVNFLTESTEFFLRANVTDPDAKWRVDQFVRGCKTLGIWDSLIVSTCYSDMGGTHQLGGSSARTNTPWSINGSLTATTDGIVGPGYVGGSNALPNNLEPQQDFTTASIVSNPVFMLIATAQDYQDTASQGRIYGASGPSGVLRNYTVIGGYSGVGADGDYISGVNSYGTGMVTYSNPKIFRDRKRPFLMGSWLHGSGSTCVNLINSLYDRRSTAGANVVHSNFAFSNGADNTSTGYIHFAALAFCDPHAVGGRAAWQRVYPLINSTLWSHKRTGGHLRVQIGGQSNASPNLATYLNRDELCDNNERCTEVFQSHADGQPITAWLGTGTPTRSATYESHFWKGDATGLLEQGRPINGIGRWREVIVWIQGESDSETDALTLAYQARLEALISFWRSDTGNSELRVIIGRIGYYRDYRTQSVVGDFTLSGATGGYTALNGTWSIQPLAAETDPYVWTKSTYTIRSTSPGWEIVDASNVVIFSTTQDVSHPQLVTTWTPGVGTGSIIIGSSRTGRIEYIRYIQQLVADADAYAENIDLRNFEYNFLNTAHLTPAGQQALAAALATQLNM